MTTTIPLARLGLCAALAASIVPGIALAQSSVTLFGVLDMGIVKSNRGTSLMPGLSTPAGAWGVQQGNDSRLGFRGQEDLGNGLYARFNLDHRFRPDTGTALNANVFWQGRSVVALGSNSLGEVYAGREYYPAFWVGLAADPTGMNYVAKLNEDFTLANYVASSAIDGSTVRFSNVVGYKTANLKGSSVNGGAGLSAEAAVALAEGTTRGRNQGLNVQYAAGPLYVGFGYDGQRGGKRLLVGTLAYNFGVAKLLANIADGKGSSRDGLGTTGLDARSATLSLAVPVGSGRIYTGLGRLDPDGDDNNSTKAMLGYEHPLSKRTKLYTNLGSAKSDGRDRTTAFDLGVNHAF